MTWLVRCAAIVVVGGMLQHCGPVQGCSDLPTGDKSVPTGICASNLPPELNTPAGRAE